MKTIHKVMLEIAIAVAIMNTVFGATVTNVRGAQRGSLNLVDIYYDLNATDGGLYTVKVEIEGKAGEVNATTFTGDVGDKIVPGKNKHVVWDAGTDWQEMNGEVKVVVSATKVVTATNGKHSGVQLWEGGPYWATTNIGASNPKDYGLYFWWGDTTGYRPSADKKFDFDFGYHNPAIYTYNHGFDVLKSEGWIVLKDGAYVLTPSHDAAHVQWGGGWRIPNYQELYDLCYTYCDWARTTMNGVNGWLVSGKGTYSSNSIFLPITGDGLGTSFSFDGIEAYYWSSHYSNSFIGCLNVTEKSHTIHSSQNNYGHSIRPVQDFSDTTMTDAVTGSSDWFFVDTTTDDTLSISDVASKYFDGEYGGDVGRQSTFMNGVSCEIEMTVLCDYSKVDHWLVNGQVVTSRTFSFDVGAIDVGGKLEIVAVGKEDGTKSKPFRANFDVAALPQLLSSLNFHAQKNPDEVVYKPTPSTIGFELAKSRTASISALDWLPQKTIVVAPEISVKIEIGSSGNGSLRLFETELNVDQRKSILGTQTRRPNGMFAEAAGVALGFSYTGGPFTAIWDAKELCWKFQSFTFGMGISGSAETPPYYWSTPTVPPIPVYVKLSAEANISAQCEVSGFGLQNGLEATFKLSGDKCPAVTVTGGAGVNNKINVEGSLAGEFPIDVTCKAGQWTSLRYGVRGTCRLTAQVFVVEATLYEWNSPTYWFIDDPSPRSMRPMLGAPASDIEWRMQPRDYLNKSKPRMRLLAAASKESSGIVESGGYPNPTPAMASGANCDALAYLRDDGTRASADRTELVVRIGTSNEWSAAESVWNDGTADFMPDVAAMSDGSIVATWANSGQIFSDDVSLPEICGAMEIGVGVRDAATGEWSCRNITGDSVLDFAPVVRAGSNGTAMVVWLRNAAGSLVGSDEEPMDIMASVYANGEWSAPTAIVSGVGSVSGFDVSFDGENAVLVFSKDADGSLETVGDMEIFAVRFNDATWGEPIQLTCAGDSDGRPFVRGGGEDGFSVLWTANGALMETRELALSNAVAVAAANGQTFGVELTMIRGVDGRDALLWNGNSTAGGAADAPTAMMYDPICGAWGSPVNLLDDGRRERRLAGAVGVDGGIRIGYESSSVSTNAEGEVSFGDVELRTRFIPAVCDLAVLEDGFSFSTNEFVNGESVALTVKAANLGFSTATNATIRVYEGAGDDKAELASVVTNFPGGGVIALNVPWTVDTTQTNLQFAVEVEACDGDNDDSNNTYIWTAGVPDAAFGGVMVRNENATRRLLTARVVNRGLGPLSPGGKVVFRRGGEDGDVLAEDEIGMVWPGADGAYDAGFAWDIQDVEFSSAWETVCVQLFPEGTAGEMADMIFVQIMTTRSLDGNLIPEVAAEADAATVNAAVDGVGFVDAAAITEVIGGSASEYKAFKNWASSVKGADGEELAGEEAVVASPHAAAAFLLGAGALFENPPVVEIGDMAVENDNSDLTEASGPAITLSVTVKDGEDAVAVASEKVKEMFEATRDLGDWNGDAKFTPTVEILTGEGNILRFRVSPDNDTYTRAFFRIRK